MRRFRARTQQLMVVTNATAWLHNSLWIEIGKKRVAVRSAGRSRASSFPPGKRSFDRSPQVAEFAGDYLDRRKTYLCICASNQRNGSQSTEE